MSTLDSDGTGSASLGTAEGTRRLDRPATDRAAPEPTVGFPLAPDSRCDAEDDTLTSRAPTEPGAGFADRESVLKGRLYWAREIEIERTRMAREVARRPKLSGVASAERVLQVLTAFRRGDDALELTELARRTGLVKSTIMRLCISLEKFDLIERLDDGRYRLGVEAARIGSVYQQSFAMEERIVPVLERLAAESLETASFYIRRGDQRLCLFRVDSPYPLRMNVRPGDMRPMDGSSIAQTLAKFAGKGASARDSIPLPIYSSGITDPHVASISMPVFGSEGRLIGALALSGPVSRLTAQRAEALAPVLRETADRLSSQLGAQS